MQPLAAVLLFVFEFQMRNVERPDSLNRKLEGMIGRDPPVRAPKLLACGPQRTKDLGPVEPLPLTMIAETHCLPLFLLPILRERGAHDDREGSFQAG